MSLELWCKTEHLIPGLLVMTESWEYRSQLLPTAWEIVAFNLLSHVLC